MKTEQYPALRRYIFSGNKEEYDRWVASLPKRTRRKPSFRRGKVQLTLFHKGVGRS